MKKLLALSFAVISTAFFVQATLITCYSQTKDIAALKQALEANPTDITSLSKLVEICSASLDYEQAAKYLDLALAIEPSNAYLLRAKGDILLQQSKLTEAEEILNKAVNASASKSSDRAFANASLAKLYLTKKDPNTARTYIDKAIEDDPTVVYFKTFRSIIDAAPNEQAQ